MCPCLSMFLNNSVYIFSWCVTKWGYLVEYGIIFDWFFRLENYIARHCFFRFSKMSIVVVERPHEDAYHYVISVDCRWQVPLTGLLFPCSSCLSASINEESCLWKRPFIVIYVCEKSLIVVLWGILLQGKTTYQKYFNTRGKPGLCPGKTFPCQGWKVLKKNRCKVW